MEQRKEPQEPAEEKQGADAEDEPVDVDSAILAHLAETQETKSLLDVMAVVLKDPPSYAQTFTVPTGSDFYINLLITIGVGIFFAYIVSAGIAFLWSVINMMMQKCGQELWKTDGDVACNAKMINALVLSIELRCFDSKPGTMLQEDFDEICSGFWMDVAGSAFFFLLTIGGILYAELGKMASKVTFRENLLVVQSWNGKLFECSFIADVTAAKATAFGLEITSKARVRTEVSKGGGGGLIGFCDVFGFCKEKEERVLCVQGNAAISVLAGSGDEKRAFLQEFAKRLPVSIQGFDGVAEVEAPSPSPPSAGPSSLLEGRLGGILAARRGQAGELKTARKPISCDLYTEALFIVGMVAICCYCFMVLMNLFAWGMATGRGKCTHEMKPNLDLCDFVNVFSPVEFPLVTVDDFVNMGGLVLACIAYPIWVFMNMPFEYRFHEKEVVEEVLFAGWQSQASTMVVQTDIDTLELVWGTFEKYVWVETNAIYTVKQGVTKPFEVTARFAPGLEMKIGLVDSGCASCSGHGKKSIRYKDSIMSALNETKPGLLQSPEAEEAEA